MGLLDTIKNIMSIPDEDFEDEEIQETEPKRKPENQEASSRRTESPRLIKSKSGNTSQASPMQIVIVNPDRYEDVTTIADHLDERKTVVLNLESANREAARRIIDFMSGAAYAHHGILRQVSNAMFIVVPSGVDMMGEINLDDFTDDKIYF